MKKARIYIWPLVFALLLTACGGSQSQEKEANNAASTEVAEAPAVEESAVSYEITYANARTWTNSIGTPWVQTIVEITNTGSENLYLSSGAYDLESPDGSLIAAQSTVSAFPSVIAPGEKGYMYEETTLENYDGDGEINVLPRPSVDKAKVDLVRYNVSDVSVSDGSFGISVMGRVENNSADATSMVYVVAFFYDGNNVPIGSAFTILTENLAPGDKVGFKLSSFSMPKDITTESIANTVVYAYPVQMQF